MHQFLAIRNVLQDVGHVNMPLMREVRHLTGKEEHDHVADSRSTRVDSAVRFGLPFAVNVVTTGAVLSKYLDPEDPDMLPPGCTREPGEGQEAARRSRLSVPIIGDCLLRTLIEH